MVGHVTLIEYAADLRADAVLQRKLASLPNVDIVTSALTTEVTGDGERVTGLRYKDRNHGSDHELLPLEGSSCRSAGAHTEWLRDTVAMTGRGEIEITDRCETSVAGVFAAGDVTTVPYKQIIVAMGEGSKASLSPSTT